MNRHEYMVLLLSHHKSYVCMAFFVLGDVIVYFKFNFLAVIIVVILSLFVLKVRLVQSLLLITFLIIGVYLTKLALEPSPNDLSSFVGETRDMKLMILGGEGGNNSYLARCIMVDYESCSGKTILEIGDDSEKLSYGDILFIQGDVFPTNNIYTSTTFDYERYLANRYIYSKVIFKKSYADREVGGGIFIRYIHKFRRFLYKRIKFLYREPNASLVGGLLVGKIITIDKHLGDIMRKSGTMHIAVVSGFNITIIITIIVKIFSSVSRVPRTSIILIIVLAFVILTGGEAPIIRAAIMGIFPIFALFFGRRINPILLLYISAFMMILFNPLSLYDLGFQLSFMATFSILIIANRLIVKFVKFPSLLSETLSTTLAAYILVSPLLALNFEEVNLTGILSNILILPLLPYIMLFSAISIVIPHALYTYNIFYYFTDILTSFEIWVMEISASFNLSFNVKSSGIEIILIYLVIFGIIFNLSFNDYKRKIT